MTQLKLENWRLKIDMFLLQWDQEECVTPMVVLMKEELSFM